MASEDGDKTEAPTPKRRQEAREQGNIARSVDLTAALLMIGSMLMLKNYGINLLTALKAFMEHSLSAGSIADQTPGNVLLDFVRGLAAVGLAMAPMMLGLMVIAVLSNVFQVGLMLSSK